MWRTIFLVGAAFLLVSGGIMLAVPLCYFEQEEGSTIDLSDICGDTSNPNEGSTHQLSAEEHFNLGLGHLNDGQIDKAIDSLSRAIDADPTNELYYSERAIAHIMSLSLENI